ncbi:MAG TPA: Asp-tRNA(Asn)/Glu-tRNA(Gln) amidotransferase subunit GatC [Candidatus Binataceae bacterium]|jgi:aspartyl-tRNA(Asn)/glutamyl-tRNA(Gln) amidotransferase subunit C|nr:Asp-tRNA(Asn)/Glu-tRNA(Gln) amidotransferase subunit GatC [Candidatus Binataceae bacterium]
MDTGNKINLEQVRHIALLARLELTPDEERRMLGDLEEMLQYVDKLNQLDTSAVEPTAQVGEIGASMREDAVTNPSAPDSILANAPAASEQMFKVPKIIE